MKKKKNMKNRVTTWFTKPTPTPSKSLPNMSMSTLKAAPPSVVPARNAASLATMDGLQPKALVI